MVATGPCRSIASARSSWVVFAMLCLCLAVGAARGQDMRASLLILDFEIEDDNLAQGAPVDVAENTRRLMLARGIVHDAFAARGPFQLTDKRAVDATIAELRRSQALHTCNGCELEIARQAGAQFVLVGWVQKVSNLILNVNAGIRNVRTGQDVLTRSVDLRGNTDPSWSRAAARLAREMIERLERAPPAP